MSALATIADAGSHIDWTFGQIALAATAGGMFGVVGNFIGRAVINAARNRKDRPS